MYGIHAARKLFALSRQEWRDMAKAQRAIISATWKLRAVKIGDLVRGTPAGTGEMRTSGTAATRGARSQAGAWTPARSDHVDRAAELALALGRVAEHGPLRPLCLVRSIALRSLLESNGVTGSEIRVGVRRDADELQAHAWVEFNGSVIGDRPDHIARFAPIDALRITEIL